jgi:hypothetical protein
MDQEIATHECFGHFFLKYRQKLFLLLFCHIGLTHFIKQMMCRIREETPRGRNRLYVHEAEEELSSGPKVGREMGSQQRLQKGKQRPGAAAAVIRVNKDVFSLTRVAPLAPQPPSMSTCRHQRRLQQKTSGEERANENEI